MEASEEEIRERCDRLAVDIYDKVGRCHICNVSHDYGHEVDCPANLHHNVRSLLDRLQTAEEREQRYKNALREIAAYGDEQANARLELTGSYGGFDCPGDVRAARKALREEADR